MMEIGIMKSKESATYVQKRFVIIKNKKKIDFNYTKKLEMIVILHENLVELVIAFAIYTISTQRNSCKNS